MPVMPRASDAEDLVSVAQEISFCLLSRWDDICRERDLEYHLGGGTLIGAIRSGGFIPWDDDVDVSMPRAEFERLRVLVRDNPRLFGANCAFDDGRATDGIGRLSLTSSSTPLGPVRMDVFTIDPVPDNPALRAVLVRAAWAFRVIAALGNGSAGLDLSRPARQAAVAARVGRIVGSRRLLALFEGTRRLAAHLASGATANCLNGSRPMRMARPTAWYDGFRAVSFEGRSFPVPAQAEQILALRYGSDYLTPQRRGAMQHVVGPLWAEMGDREWHVP